MKHRKSKKKKRFMARKVVTFILSLFMLACFALALICVIGNNEGVGNIVAVSVPLVLSLIIAITAFRQGRVASTISLVLTLLFTVSFTAFVASTVFISFGGIPERGDCTVIVLGAKTNGYIPSNSLVSRLDAAYDYLKVNTDAVCIVAGGKGADETVSEAESMKNYLVKNKKLSEERVFKEEKSACTEENLSFSAEIIRENGLDGNPVVIVTNRFHVIRAYFMAKNLGSYSGMSVGCIPAEGPAAFLTGPKNYAREYCALVKYFADCLYRTVTGK